MHPLSTFEVHRQDQVALLRRSTRQGTREPVPRSRDDAHGRPPDPRSGARRTPPGRPTASTARPVAP